MTITGRTTRGPAQTPPTPMTLERASAFVLPFGRHRGRPLAEVAEIDPGWIEWFAREGEAKTVKRACAFYVDHVLSGGPTK